MSPSRRVQRTAADVLVRDGGSVLLVGGYLPGAVVGHGEHPRDAALRGLAEATGLTGTGPRPVSAGSDVAEASGRQVHTLRLVYDVRVAPGEARAAPGELVPAADLGALPRAPLAAASVEDPPAGPGELPTVLQRPAAYAVLTGQVSGAERLLLTRLTGSGGLWTLPGGGIDFGEDPVVGLRREVHEETGLPYTPGPLLDVLSRHFTGRAPSGRLEDFHGISLLYGGSVPVDVEPRVVEIGGSTDAAAWHPLPGLGGVRAVPSVHQAVRHWRGRRA